MLSKRINGKKILFTALLFVLMFSCSGVKSQAKWIQNKDGTYSWIRKNGRKAKSTWINNRKYVDANGNRVTGKQKINGKYYYFKKSNGMVMKNTWIKIGSQYDYALSSGVLCKSGRYKIGDYYYYFNRKANRKTGLKTISGKQYYFDPGNQGRMVESKWVKIDGKYYRFNSNGVMLKNTWVSNTYYVGSDGASYTGLHTIDKKIYYFDPSTRQKVTNTTKTVDNVTYEFDKNGVGKKVEAAKSGTVKNAKYVFVGDSRTVGMQSAVGDKSDTIAYIADESTGYSWLKNTAGTELENQLKSTPTAKVILAFGINDLGNISNYISYYNELIKTYPKATFYMMSVNPVKESTAKKNGYTVTNSQISTFNTKLKNAFPKRYLDVYSYLNKNGFSTSDGIHYTSSTYTTIYNYVISLIG